MTSSSEPDTGATDALERSQQAIDEGNEAAREALGDQSPTSDLDVPATGDGLEAQEEGEVAPRPN